MKDYLTIFMNANLHTKSFKDIMLFHVEIRLLKSIDEFDLDFNDRQITLVVKLSCLQIACFFPKTRV